MMGGAALSMSKGKYNTEKASKKCVHQIPEGGYGHSNNVGESDNLWSLIYPPPETLQVPTLLEAPVAYDFSTILTNKKDYHD